MASGGESLFTGTRGAMCVLLVVFSAFLLTCLAGALLLCLLTLGRAENGCLLTMKGINPWLLTVQGANVGDSVHG